MFDEMIDRFTKKTMHKSAKTVKKEIKKKVNNATTGENGQKLLITACVISVSAMIISIFARNSKPVIVNVYH